MRDEQKKEENMKKFGVVVGILAIIASAGSQAWGEEEWVMSCDSVRDGIARDDLNEIERLLRSKLSASDCDDIKTGFERLKELQCTLDPKIAKRLRQVKNKWREKCKGR